MTQLEVIGVHPIDYADEVHLVEVLVTGSEQPFDLSAITQRETDRSRGDWQVPYDEKILDERGENILADPWFVRDDSIWHGDVRLAFFFHFLDTDEHLETPFGNVALPAPSPPPARLAFMEYEPP